MTHSITKRLQRCLDKVSASQWRVALSVVVIAFGAIEARAEFPNLDSLSSIAYVKPGSRHLRFLPETNIPARELFTTYASKFELGEADQMVLVDTAYRSVTGLMYYHFQQVHRGLPVQGGEMRVRERNGRCESANGLIIVGLNLDSNPGSSEEFAFSQALNFIGADTYMWEDSSEEALLREDEEDSLASYFPVGRLTYESYETDSLTNSDGYRLCYEFNIFAASPWSHDLVYVDASTGEIVRTISLIKYTPATAQTYYDGLQTIQTDYDMSRDAYRLNDYTRGNDIRVRNANGGTSTGDADDIWHDDTWWEVNTVATQAMFSLEQAWDYFYEVHGLESFNGSGKKVKAYINWDGEAGGGSGFFAMWDGRNIVFDDDDPGDGRTTTTELDIAGHEFTHGVISKSAKLDRSDEGPSLNEGFADIFGTCSEWRTRRGNAVDEPQPDWEFGGDKSAGDGHRNLKNPNDEGDPDTYKGINWNLSDNYPHGEGVVLGHWFYLVCEGGSGVNDNGTSYQVDGIGMYKAEIITFETLMRLDRSSGFGGVRDESLEAVEDLYGTCSPEHYAVVNAWKAVGLSSPETYEYQTSATLGTTIFNEFELRLGPTFVVPNGDVLNARSMTQVRLVPGTTIENGAEFNAAIGCH